jgi:hypothetical protein
MQRLLNEPVYHRRYPERSDPARWLWDIDSSYRSRQITAFQQGDLHAWPVHLQPVFELGYRYIIDARRSFVLNHPLIRQLQVAAFDHLFHEPVVLPFRSPGCRRAKLRTPSISARLLAGTLRRGHPCGCFCFIASLRDHPSYSRLRCSALRRYRLVWSLLTSAVASENLSVPVPQRHACRSPRVSRTYFHAYARRIYVTAFRTCIGLCKRLYPLPVRRASALLPASFRLSVTRETVAFR